MVFYEIGANREREEERRRRSRNNKVVVVGRVVVVVVTIIIGGVAKCFAYLLTIVMHVKIVVLTRTV